MHLDAMHLFCAIVETRSVTRGAARRHITQSAASQQLRAIEERLGQRLLDRGPAGVRPTAAGAAAYQVFREILDRFAALERQVQEMGQVVAGTLRVATIYSVGLHDLPPYIKRFLQLYPGCRIHQEYLRSDRIYELVAQGMFDVGVVAYAHETRGLGVIPMQGDELVLIAPPSHPLTRSTAIKPEQLNGQRFIAFARDIPTRRALDRLLHQLGVEVEIVMELDNVETIKRSVEAELGISIVPRRGATREAEAGSLAVRSLDAPGFHRPVGLLYRRGRSFPPALQQFVRLLTSELEPDPNE